MRIRIVTAIAVTLLLAATPVIGSASDGFDAPALDPGRLDADINDLYVFQGADSTATTLAMTVSPAAGVVGPGVFGTDVVYQFNVVATPTAAPFGFQADTAFRATFGSPDAYGVQQFSLYRSDGDAADGHQVTPADLVVTGTTDQTVDLPDGGTFFAGLRSDPFFFDLAGFRGSLGEASNGRTLGDGQQTDFFDRLNVLALVLELPDYQLPPQAFDLGAGLAVWASTAVNDGGWVQVDRAGKPLVNPVVNSAGTIVNAPAGSMDFFNRTHPGDDSRFQQAVREALTALSALDGDGVFAGGALEGYADLFLADMLPYNRHNTSPTAIPGLLAGRRLEDDVVDITLNVMSGGDPLGFFSRDEVGAFPSDGVGPHADYLPVFPYLGEPHPGPSFVALTPHRLEDTRQPGGAKIGSPDGAAEPLTINVLNRGGVPATDVGAVSLNVTVDRGELPDLGGGYVTVDGCATPRPTAQQPQLRPRPDRPQRRDHPGLTTGEICVYVYGTAHILVDINGYFPTGSDFGSVTPFRLEDTRQVAAQGRLRRRRRPPLQFNVPVAAACPRPASTRCR